MSIHEIDLPANKQRRRSGRGISAGRGKTAGRGTKGQKARAGGNVRPGFEGGQNPLFKRIPKLPGFRSRRPRTQTLTLKQLSRHNGKNVTNQTLKEQNLVSDAFRPVRVVAGGELKTALSVHLQGASAAARNAIEKAGGTFKSVDTPRPKSSRPAGAATKSPKS